MDIYFDAKCIIETDQILSIAVFYLRKSKRNIKKYFFKCIHVPVEQNKMNPEF